MVTDTTPGRKQRGQEFQQEKEGKRRGRGKENIQTTLKIRACRRAEKREGGLGEEENACQGSQEDGSSQVLA